ncbi:MAG: DUF2141 domain-containing protein [Rhodothermaceae bacterium]
MKTLILIIYCCSAFIFMQDELKGDIQIKVTDLPSSKGKVMLAVYNSKENFEQTGIFYKNAELEIVKRTASFTFKDLPYGEYAIKLYHDENSNRLLDTGLFGIPTEGYAFSNNASGFMGPATYNASKFKLDKKRVTQTSSVK